VKDTINSGEVTVTISANVTTAFGGHDIYFDDDKDADAYREDPDGFAARYFGLSREDYREWVLSNGRPMCGAVTKRGTLCKNPARNSGGHQCDHAEWQTIGRTIHRQVYCGIHAECDP
jgi:hypothetical protein